MQLQPESSPEKASSSVESDAVPNHLLRRRPATTEGAGVRPRTILENRPKTATDRPSFDAPTKLEILNTLMGIILNILLVYTLRFIYNCVQVKRLPKAQIAKPEWRCLA